MAGAILSAIGLHSSLREQAVKVRAARVLGRAVPTVRLKSDIDPATLSRDPAVVEAYRDDKLVHDIASLGFGLDALEAIDAIVAGAPRISLPLLRHPRQRGHGRLRVGRARAAALAPDACTLHVYDGLFHEIHHEPERDRVLDDVLAWVERHSVTDRLPMMDGTREQPWVLKTPSGGSEFMAFRDESLDPPALVVQVGKTELRYHLRCIDDLHAMLREHGDWMPLGSADEQKPAAEGTVEAWARVGDNPVGGWYGLKKGLRGRFGIYVPPVLEALGLRRGRAQPAEQPDARALARTLRTAPRRSSAGRALHS